MTSLEALENIAITFDEGGYEPTTLGAKRGHFREVFGVEFNIIEQDLKRLNQLEEENQELKQKLEQIKSFSYSMPSYYRNIIKEVLENDK